MSRFLKTAVALIPFALTVACTDPAKAPAEAAMSAAETAMKSLEGDVAKYAPEGVQGIQKTFASAKELIAKQDYKGALAAAGDIPAKVKEVVAAAAAKKDQLLKAWRDVEGKLPGMVSAIKSRLGILSQSKKLPAGLDKAALAKANDGVAAVESGWAKVVDDFKGGKLTEASAGAKELLAKGSEIMKSLGMQ